MFKIDKKNYRNIATEYSQIPFFFPLIGAVLSNMQDGVVYVDHPVTPNTVYVEHSFGFAQFFGKHNSIFNEKLRSYLTKGQAFIAPKVRLYACGELRFLSSIEDIFSCSLRQRFVLNKPIKDCAVPVEIEIKPPELEQLFELQSYFGVVDRFWRSHQDFLQYAHAIVAWRNRLPVAICYAAAVANNQAEIDVFTVPAYRQIGLGKLVVQRFIQECLREGIQPVWDCFTNNAASMALSRTSGFLPAGHPYPFYTFNRQA